MPTASGDPLVTFFKEQEQRTRLRALPMEQQMRVYQEAVRRGESTVQRAVKDPAFTAEMLAEKQFADFVARVDKEHVEHGKPEQWARLQTLEKTAGWLQTLAGAIEGLMSGYGQMPAFKANPVGKMDLSLTDQTRAPKKKAAIDTAPAGGVQALK